MKPLIPLTVVCLLVLAGYPGVQSAAASPWHSAVDRLPPFPSEIELSLTIECKAIVTYEPVIARITLTNRDEKRLVLKTREDGTPHAVASLVAPGDDSFFRDSQRLYRSGPGTYDRSLEPGESTSGEILILFGPPPTGFPFAAPERYRIKFACQPEHEFAPVYSNELSVSVSPDNRQNLKFLRDLSQVTYGYFGYDQEWYVQKHGKDALVATLLLKKIIREDGPYRVDQEKPREVALVDSLTQLLERYPESSYAGYVARFLGLVHLDRIEQWLSKGERKAWRETGKPPTWDSSTFRADPSYQKALRYLTIAEKADLWPRTTAVLRLAQLHGAAREWDKVSECCESLRTKCANTDGPRLADELERQLTKYKRKLEESRKKQVSQAFEDSSE